MHTTQSNKIGLRNRLYSIAVAVFLGGVSVAAYCLGSAARSAAPMLEVSAAALDFGEVWAQPAFQWDLPIKNTSNAQVTIEKFDLSCNCVAIEPKRLVVPAHSSSNVRLTLDLAKARLSSWGRAVDNIDLQILPRVAEAPYQDISWTLRGKVKRPFVFEPAQLSQWQEVRRQAFAGRTIRLTSLIPAPAFMIRCVPKVFSARIVNTAKTHDQYELTLRPGQSVPAGAFHVDLTIQVRIPGLSSPFSTTIPVDGYLRDDVAIIPEAIHFGPRPLSSHCQQDLALASDSGRPFEFVSTETSSDAIELGPLTLDNAGRSGTGLRLKLTVVAEGQQRGWAKIRLREHDGRPRVITIPIEYYGLPSRR